MGRDEMRSNGAGLISVRWIKSKATLIGLGMEVGFSGLVLDEKRNVLFSVGKNEIKTTSG